MLNWMNSGRMYLFFSFELVLVASVGKTRQLRDTLNYSRDPRAHTFPGYGE